MSYRTKLQKANKDRPQLILEEDSLSTKMSFNEPPRGYSYSHHHHQPYSQPQSRLPPNTHPMSLLHTNAPRPYHEHDRPNYALPSPSHTQSHHYHHDSQSISYPPNNHQPHPTHIPNQYREPGLPASTKYSEIETPSSSTSPSSSRRPSTTQNSRALPISGLLSTETSPTLPSGPIYSIRVRQQPAAARACGFGERDRRVIDPPPILQMHVDSPTSTKEQISAMIRNNYCVVHCTLWDPITDKEDTAMPGTNDKKQQRRLMGTLVSSPFVGLDEHNVEGCFFTFPDLSVRTPGRYALRFSLVVLDPSNMRPGGSATIKSSVKTVPFQVYNAKDFLGMRASSELTKRLKHQGCLISVKKGNAKTNALDGHNEDDEEDEYDDDHRREEYDDGGQRKRVKRVPLAPAQSTR